MQATQAKKKRKLWKHIIIIDFLKPSAKETSEEGNAERGGRRRAEKPKRGVKQVCRKDARSCARACTLVGSRAPPHEKSANLKKSETLAPITGTTRLSNRRKESSSLLRDQSCNRNRTE